MSIDLRPYGLKWTLDPTKPAEYIPARPRIATVTHGKFAPDASIKFKNVDDTIINFTLDRYISRGSFGETWLLKERYNSKPTVVKISKPNPLNREALLEFLIQLVCAEDTRNDEFDGHKGPFVPEVFLFGFNQDPAQYERVYIFSEYIDDTLFNVINRPDAQTPVFLKDCIAQIGKILDILHSKDKFSHRDFKTDNIMLSIELQAPWLFKYNIRTQQPYYENSETGATVNEIPIGPPGTYHIKLIDFGFSCLDHMGIQMNSDPSHLFHFCNKPSRDMSSLFYNLNTFSYLKDLSERESSIKRVMNTLLLTGDVPGDWFEQYTFYNIQPTNPNLLPSTVYNIFKNLEIIKKQVRPEWVKYLQFVNRKMLPYLNVFELLALPVEVTDTITDKSLFVQYPLPTRDSPDPKNVLCFVARNEKKEATIKAILEKYNTPEYLNGLCRDALRSPIHNAITASNVEFIKQILEIPGFNSRVILKGGYSLLVWAVTLGGKADKLNIIKLLLDKDPGLVNIANDNGTYAEQGTTDREIKELIEKTRLSLKKNSNILSMNSNSSNNSNNITITPNSPKTRKGGRRRRRAKTAKKMKRPRPIKAKSAGVGPLSSTGGGETVATPWRIP